MTIDNIYQNIINFAHFIVLAQTGGIVLLSVCVLLQATMISILVGMRRDMKR